MFFGFKFGFGLMSSALVKVANVVFAVFEQFEGRSVDVGKEGVGCIGVSEAFEIGGGLVFAFAKTGDIEGLNT